MAKSNRNLTDIFQDTANAIRGKTGLSEPINPRDFADEIDSIPTGGGGDEFVGLVERNISVVNNNEITKVGPYVFQGCSSLVSVNLPNCLRIEQRAFPNCTSLSSISFPNCSHVENAAFQDCYSLTSANFPNCSYIGDYAFQGCSSLTSISFPSCTQIATSAFTGCHNLESVNIPKCGTIFQSAFANCWKLVSLNLPECFAIHYQAFAGCTSLTEVSSPSLYTLYSAAFSGCINLNHIDCNFISTVESYTFRSCSSMRSFYFLNASNVYNGAFADCITLSEVFLGGCSRIFASAFSNCHSLETLSLFMFNSIVTLMNSNAFQGTPIADSSYLGHFGSIYVPAILLETYKSATNWAYYSDRIISLPSEFNSIYAFGREFYRSSITEIPSEKKDVSIICHEAFFNCNFLSINLSNCTEVGQSAFGACTSLRKVVLPNCSVICFAAFSACYSLSELYLLSNSVVLLNGFNWFYSTPIVSSYYLGYFGSIYVRASLLSEYQVAPNWSYYSARLVGLTDEEIAALE